MDILNNIGIILDRTRHAANIGAVCRVLKNLGYKNLHLVNPTKFGHLSAVRMLRGSEDLLESATVHSSLADAVSTYHYTFATSRRMKQEEAVDIQTGAREIAELSRENRVALIFGSEKFGLSHSDIAKADRIVKLPSEPEFPSVNLSQAVTMLILTVKMELYKNSPDYEKHVLKPEIKHLPKGERERFYEAMASLSREVGFDTSSVLEKIRRVFDRANMTKREQNLFLGLIKELRKKSKNRL